MSVDRRHTWNCWSIIKRENSKQLASALTGSGKYLGDRCFENMFCNKKYNVEIPRIFAILVVPPAQIPALLQPHQVYPTLGGAVITPLYTSYITFCVILVPLGPVLSHLWFVTSKGFNLTQFISFFSPCCPFPIPDLWVQTKLKPETWACLRLVLLCHKDFLLLYLTSKLCVAK